MEINFIISEIYNSLFGNIDMEMINGSKNRLKQLWKGYNKEILNIIYTETKCKFEKGNYDCYLVSNFPCRGISHPLTIKTRGKHLGDFVTLIHELIHVLMVENKPKFKPIIDQLKKDYPKTTHKEIIHVIIFDLLKKIIHKIFKENIIENLEKHIYSYKEAYKILKEIKKINYL